MKNEINALIMEAMKNHDTVRTESLRAIKSAFLNWQTSKENAGKDLTDADEIQVTRGGVSTALLSLPLKYMHTPAEVIDLRDAEAVTELVCLWARSFGEEGQNA